MLFCLLTLRSTRNPLPKWVFHFPCAWPIIMLIADTFFVFFGEARAKALVGMRVLMIVYAKGEHSFFKEAQFCQADFASFVLIDSSLCACHKEIAFIFTYLNVQNAWGWENPVHHSSPPLPATYIHNVYKQLERTISCTK